MCAKEEVEINEYFRNERKRRRKYIYIPIHKCKSQGKPGLLMKVFVLLLQQQFSIVDLVELRHTNSEAVMLFSNRIYGENKRVIDVLFI